MKEASTAAVSVDLEIVPEMSYRNMDRNPEVDFSAI
jgi:hypothetical protein